VACHLPGIICAYNLEETS